MQYESFHKNNKIQKRIIKQDNFTYRNVLSVLSNYLLLDINVLDVGCGSGALSFYMAQSGCRVLGVDVSKNAINLCKENAKRLGLINKIDFLVGDFTNMNLKRKFNLVLFSEIVEHLRNDKEALNKVYEYLKPKGILILSAPSQNALLYKLGLVKKFDKKVGHLRRYQLSELIKLCEDVGFKILETRKTEGFFRNLLFVFKSGDALLRLANRFSVFSFMITFIDNIFLKLLGESQIFLIAKKP